mmetsp:Transcript_124178/g.362394  ORF Transcript_124178/g.362394 Transcript_124178/m.362394 type:complete len:235 (+) Transcript_124178:1527-2231(+)
MACASAAHVGRTESCPMRISSGSPTSRPRPPAGRSALGPSLHPRSLQHRTSRPALPLWRGLASSRSSVRRAPTTHTATATTSTASSTSRRATRCPCASRTSPRSTSWTPWSSTASPSAASRARTAWCPRAGSSGPRTWTCGQAAGRSASCRRRPLPRPRRAPPRRAPRRAPPAPRPRSRRPRARRPPRWSRPRGRTWPTTWRSRAPWSSPSSSFRRRRSSSTRARASSGRPCRR